MELYKLFSVIVLLSAQVSGDSATFLSVSPEKTEKVGSQVEFECKASGPIDYPLLWTKVPSDDIPDLNDPRNNLPDKRTDMVSGKNSSFLTLKITDIQASDAGQYRCEIYQPASAKRVVANTRLTVEQSPFIFDYSSQSVTVVVGDDAKLVCYAEGVPKPTVYWRRENNDLLPEGHSIFNGNVFQINNVREQDGGTYYCVADNGVGKSAYREVKVKVKFSAKIVAVHAGYGQVLGKKVDLQCTAYGYPPVSVSWFKDRKQITTGNNSRISTTQIAEAKLSTVLTIDAVAKSDYGDYFCKAENSHGSDEQKIELYDTTKFGAAEFLDSSDGNWCCSSVTMLLLSMAFLFTTRFVTSG